MSQAIEVEDRSCVFLDLSNYAWSEEGCRPNPELSSASTTVCDCNHLTNFGIILDWSGEALPYDRYLDTTSTICMAVSTSAIILTEVVLSLQRWEGVVALSRGQGRVERRRRMEQLRNWLLGLAQLAWLLLTDKFTVSTAVCQVFGAITHLLWSLFWASTGDPRPHRDLQVWRPTCSSTP